MPDLTERQAAACETVLELSDWALGHVRQVKSLASSLFDELRPFHALGEEERVPLLAAALLHDVGYPTDPDQHNKVSARIIRAHLGPPFTADQVELIALLARYHRKAVPKLKHRRYAALDDRGRRLITWLGGMLRVADGLDREHDGAVRWLACGRVDGMLELRVADASPAPAHLVASSVASVPTTAGERAPARPLVSPGLEADVRGGLRKRDLLARALGMPVVIRAV